MFCTSVSFMIFPMIYHMGVVILPPVMGVVKFFHFNLKLGRRRNSQWLNIFSCSPVSAPSDASLSSYHLNSREEGRITHHATHGAHGRRATSASSDAQDICNRPRRQGCCRHLPCKVGPQSSRRLVWDPCRDIRHHDEGSSGHLEPADVEMGDKDILVASRPGPFLIKVLVHGVPTPRCRLIRGSVSSLLWP